MTRRSHNPLGPLGAPQAPGTVETAGPPGAPSSSGDGGPHPHADLAAEVPRYLQTAAPRAHGHGPLQHSEHFSADWNQLTVQTARLRQQVRGTVPSFSSMQARTIEILALSCGFAAVLIVSAVIMVADEQDGSLLVRLAKAAGTLILAGGLVVGGIMLDRYQKRVRTEFGRLAQKLGISPLEGRAAGLAELDWLDEHRWGQAPFLECSSETGSFRIAARSHRHGVPVLVTMAHSAGDELRDRRAQSLTSVFVSRPGSYGRYL